MWIAKSKHKTLFNLFAFVRRPLHIFFTVCKCQHLWLYGGRYYGGWAPTGSNTNQHLWLVAACLHLLTILFYLSCIDICRWTLRSVIRVLESILCCKCTSNIVVASLFCHCMHLMLWLQPCAGGQLTGWVFLLNPVADLWWAQCSL